MKQKRLAVFGRKPFVLESPRPEKRKLGDSRRKLKRNATPTESPRSFSVSSSTLPMLAHLV
jgi:hypothetical protein